MENSFSQIYPVILNPAVCSIPILQSDTGRNRKNKSHGQSELVAFARFFKYGGGEIREDVCVRLCGHNYEPDFAYINKEKGICIDIEVDEPYSCSEHPIHFLMADGTNKDSVRNHHFQEAGWYVIRFSEKQMFCHTQECLREIYKLAMAAGAVSELPKSLQHTSDLQPQARWTKNESYRMIGQHYRKSYLGYDPVRMGLRGCFCCTWRILPVMWQSIWIPRLRHEMHRQLRGFLFRH